MLDMHFHSNLSDGKNSVEEILSEANKKGLEYAFLTDHDRISYDFLEKSEKYLIKSCESTEISAVNLDNDFSLHITYYARKISEKLRDLLDNVVETKPLILDLQLEKLNDFGFDISREAFYEYCLNKGRLNKYRFTKFDLAEYVLLSEKNKKIISEITGGNNGDVLSFYLDFLKKEGKYFQKYGYSHPNYEVSIEKIKEFSKIDNAVVSIAHPNFTFKSIDDFSNSVDEYILKGGINAIEINSKATKEMIDLIISLSNEKGLYITFGSDNHGIGSIDNKHQDFGVLNPGISPEFIKSQFDRYKSRLGLD